jgi:proteasome lid subunit RPN8/RPN11
MSIVRAEYKCPYCGVLQGHRVEADGHGKQVINCDQAEGGCDKYFVIDIPYSHTLPLEAKKIEEEA